MTLWESENEYLHVEVAQNAVISFHDKVNNVRWMTTSVALQEEGQVEIGHVWLRSGRSTCEQYPARFHGTPEGDGIRFTVLGRVGRQVGTIRCVFQLDGPWFECRIEEIDETLESLIFPPPIETESLVVPMGVGKWIRKPMSERKFWIYPSHMNMRWFGGLRGEAGWMAVIDRSFTDSGAFAAEMTMAPAWLKSMGRWQGERAVRYRFGTGGYVGLARLFRAYAIDKKLHRPIAEKMRELPAVANLKGGRHLSIMQAMSYYSSRDEDLLRPPGTRRDDGSEGVNADITFAQASQIFREARDQGMKRGLMVVRGWIQGGYDESHPDVWPPEPSLGSVAELAELCKASDPYSIALHDNYQDIYTQTPSWPGGVCITRDGHPMPAGYWAGGQAYVINSRDGLAYAKRNWEQIKQLSPNAMFIDTTTAMQYFQSYEEGNTLTRRQDHDYKHELLQFYKDQGLALGSEEGQDFGMDLVDWVENRHARVPGESIPLWSLVYHDAAFYARYGGGATAKDSGGAPNWLTDMLWGYMLLWGVRRMADWTHSREAFTQYDHVDHWHARIGADDMIGHRYLTEDGEVEETVFASGAAIWVNFSREPRSVEGVSVPAHGYVIRY